MKSRERRPGDRIKEQTNAVTIQSSTEAVQAYQSLLLTDWSDELPAHVLSLLSSIVKKDDDTTTAPLLQVLDPDGTKFDSDYFESIVDRIVDSSKLVGLAELPMLSDYSIPRSRLSRAARQANSLSTYLTLPAHATVIGDIDFFVDVLALAFQASIHFVLPATKLRNRKFEHALLLRSMVLFSVSYSAYDPGHYAYMLSEIHGYLGNKRQRIRSLYAAFKFTSPHDHSYLTKAQELWSELMDQEKYDEVEDFVFSLGASSLATQQVEIREMAVDAFRQILSCRSHAS